MTKRKSTKQALLLSALSLLLCVSMLIGSTFAWFTDSVTSSGNIIKSGTLDVEMYWAKGTEAPDSANWEDASKGAIFNYDKWEPGYTEVRHVKIENVGTLAFKYVVNIKANGEVSKLAEVIDVYFVDPATQVSDRAALLDTYKVGTLADVLAGTAGTTHGDLIAGASDSITIALKMQESAGNEYQGLSLGSDFSVQVLATQLTSEKDSFDDQYDKDAVTYVTYDSSKTDAENAAALQAALDAAEEGDIILLSAGNWYATQYKQFKINTDNITLVGENGAVLGFENENRNSILDVYGDNVTIRNIEFNKNKQEFNQCILAIGAENLTVDSCTFYGDNYQGGNTPTMGVYLFENLDSASDEANDAVTKYTITNNSFNGASVGMYKGGSATVPTDPGVAAAVVSEDMVIKNNTFTAANILIENWRSWSKECTRDHEFVPTISGNNFVSPNLCFANTPHSIYLRCYRQGDPDKILPAGYIDAFVANNTIATPANDTVVNYGGTNYVLSNDYGTFYRDNATYGTIAYCYGQSYATVVNSAADFSTAIANGGNVVLGTGNYTLPSVNNGDVTISGDKDTVITVGKPNYTGSDVTFNGVTVKGSGYATGVQHVNTVTYNDATIVGVMCLYGEKVVFNNCTFDLTAAADYIWTYGAKNVEFNNCTFNTLGKAILIYNEGADLVTNVSVKGCTFNATQTALASGHPAAAIEIDSSLATNGHYTLVTENNTVDSDFAGEWRIKKSGTNNTTVNGTVYNAVTIDGSSVTY